jgi:hypothetical protein
MLEQVEIPGTKEGPPGTVEAVNISAFKKGMPELERLYMDQQGAAEEFAACVKAVVEKSGLKPAVIRKAVKAKVDDRLDDARYEAEQLSMALEEVGG